MNARCIIFDLFLLYFPRVSIPNIFFDTGQNIFCKTRRFLQLGEHGLAGG